jgi:hypothetical protein
MSSIAKMSETIPANNSDSIIHNVMADVFLLLVVLGGTAVIYDVANDH